MNVTKNRQSNDQIIRMAKAAFPDKRVLEIRELDDGFCNVTYDVTFEDGSESILKIAAVDRSGNTSNEINLMSAETKAMKLVRRQGIVRTAEVQYYDTSRRICSSDYFFMEKIQGDNYNSVKAQLPEDTVRQINQEIGGISRRLTEITNREFGFLGDSHRFGTLYEFTEQMLKNLLHDAKQKNVDIVYREEDFLDGMEKDKNAFEGIMPATLVHWDMWEGNVFVRDGHVSGIIDWERAMWGEAFMDDRFRYHSRNSDFLTGFGQTSFTENEMKRIRWYDIILYLTMMIEVYYREYETESQYFWAKEKLMTVWPEDASF
jgi:aminoglycoside phosphotransferase (APT) family kinase protein